MLIRIYYYINVSSIGNSGQEVEEYPNLNKSLYFVRIFSCVQDSAL